MTAKGSWLDSFRSLRIRNKLLASFLVFFIPFSLAGTLVVYTLVKKTIRVAIESELDNTNALVVDMVRRAASLSIKNHLRAIAEKNLQIITHLYGRYQSGEVTRDEAIAQIRGVLLSQTIGKNGYIYCLDSSATLVLHPHPEMEGRDVSEFAFVREQLRLKTGYIEYDWRNPGESVERPKALYMVYCPELDWIISASSYREEFADLIAMEDFRRSILALRTGQSGYSFVLDAAGNVIVHPRLEGINIYADQPFPTAFARQMLALKNGQLVYDWQNPDEPNPRSKLVVFRFLPEYQWLVASSSYLDEIFKPLAAVRNLILAALLATLVLALVMTFHISALITRPLKTMMERFERGASGDFSVRMDLRFDDELGQLAGYFNAFMEKLETYSAGLKSEITERGRAEAAVRESEARYRELYESSTRGEQLYRSLLNSSSDAIVFYDMQGNPLYVNPAFTRIFGWTLEELAGRKIPFVPESEKAITWKVVQDVMVKGLPCSGFETRRLTKDGKTLEISISGSRYNDHLGQPAGMLSILRDISKTKQLEARFQQAQRLEAIGTLAGGVAHDFNNLMMGIQGRVSLMQLDAGPTHPMQKHLDAIQSCVDTAADLTRQLLGFARAGKYEVRPLDLNRVIGKSAEMFGRTRKEISIQTRFAPDLWTVAADQSQIEQVLLNLFVNAGQAMGTGGTLRLATANLNLSAEQVTAFGLAPGPYVRITVADTGRGMDEETVARIFDPFFTTREKTRGAGLGLAAVYGIIQNHGGFIEVDSQPGQGTTFSLFLPACPQAAAVAPLPAPVLAAGTGTILLVDDEEMILDVGRMMLKKLGYQVVVAQGGEQALNVFQTRAIDLVILDMVMPAMSGGETFDRLKAIDPAVRVLLSSGYSIDDQTQAIIDRGCRGFIQKPYRLDMLAAKIRETLNAA